MSTMTATETIPAAGCRPEPMTERVLIRCYPSYEDDHQ